MQPNTVVMAQIAYRLAEFLGAEAPVVQALALAAETGDESAAAEAWDLILALPTDTRQALANWIAQEQRSELPADISAIFKPSCDPR